MKNLYIIRHAKAKLFREGQEDHDRELNKTGKIEASICGKWINNLDKKLDIIYSSSSVRTHQTTKIIIEEIEYNPQIIIEPKLYLSEEHNLLNHIKALDDNMDNVAIIGHEPGLKRLAVLLTGNYTQGLEGVLEKKFSTSTVAIITFNVSLWSALSEREGYLFEYFNPKDQN